MVFLAKYGTFSQAYLSLIPFPPPGQIGKWNGNFAANKKLTNSKRTVETHPESIQNIKDARKIQYNATNFK